MNSRKHKVLLFGESVFGSQKPKLSVDYCDIDLIAYPKEYEKLSHLTEYDLVILDYSAFYIGGMIREHEQEVFEKQMMEALDKGTCFCILHYDEDVPAHNKYHSDSGYMDKEGIERCNESEIGFRWLRPFQIRPHRFNSQVIAASIHRNEFKMYLERWGASKNVFKPFGDGKFSDVIFSLDGGLTVGFSIFVRRGKILYLPCQRDFNRPQSITECLTTLINSTLTYLTRSNAEIPSWAKTPLFSKETEFYNQLTDLELKIKGVESALEPYQEAKKLAFLSEYDFEEEVPKFFTSHLGLPTDRNEQFKEDFWILDANGQKKVIAETKSCVRGFKKGGVYSLYSHRESGGFEESFPAIIVINAHLNANSWEDKLRPIDRQDYECAAANNILLLRIEDVLFFWNSAGEKPQNGEKLLTEILNHKGWMEVKLNGEIDFHQ